MDRADQLYRLLHNGKPPASDMDAESRTYYQKAARIFDATGPYGVVQLSGHSLRVMFEPDVALVRMSLVCHETSRASCHLVCSQGCEQWNKDDHEHPLVETNECNAVAWIGNAAEEYCALHDEDPSFSLYDGMPVTITWDADTYVWAPIPNDQTYVVPAEVSV